MIIYSLYSIRTNVTNLHCDGVTVPDNLVLYLDDIVLTSMEELYDTCTEDDT